MLRELGPTEYLQHALDLHFGKLVVIVFYGEWNKQSLKFKDALAASLPLFGQFDNVVYLTASAERCPDAFKIFNIAYLPTVVFTDPFRKILRKFETDDVGVVLDSLAEEADLYRNNFQKQRKLWFGKIGSIIAESPVILFKQDSLQAAGSNSASLLDLLRRYGVEFTSYNVAENSKISLWVRCYSGLQTFPQLFSEGKFVGGTSICLQLDQKGEFLSKIPKANLPLKKSQKLKQLCNTHKVLILTDKFSSESNEIQHILNNLKFTSSDIAVYNVAIDKKLHEQVLEQYHKTLPLVLIEGKCQQ